MPTSTAAATATPRDPAASTLSDAQILAIPARDWTVLRSSPSSGDVDYRATTLAARVDGKEARLVATDYSYRDGQRPDELSSAMGQHHWNSKHPLFDKIASAIVSDTGATLTARNKEIHALVSGSVPEQWEKGPRSEYMGGEFNFGGVRRSFCARAGGNNMINCEAGFVGRLDGVSVFAQKLAGEEPTVELAVSRGDYSKVMRLEGSEAQALFDAITSHCK